MTFALQLSGIGFLALVFSYLSVAALRRWAERRKILDIPNERSSHTGPVARGGGLAIVVITLAGLIAFSFFKQDLSWKSLLTYVIGAVLIAAISWLDDLHSLPRRIRFAAHSLGATVAILGFGYYPSVTFPFLGQLQLHWLSLPITFLWIVGLTNAYNFMDGIDGIAGGQAVVAGLGWAVLGWLNDLTLITTLGVLVAASSLGFLGHNWPPARIFMGDVGSAFLGYTFAILPVITAQDDPRLALAGVLLVWPFVFDTSFTFFRRWHNGENVFAAHRSHLYQRLVIAGCSHRFVTLLYIGLAAIGALLALAWSQNIPGSGFLIALFMPLLCLMLWAFVTRQERLRSLNAKWQRNSWG